MPAISINIEKQDLQPINSLPGQGWGLGVGTEGPWGRVLKDLHPDSVSPVFESVFHAGHFYRAIQSQDVRRSEGLEGAAMSGIG